MATYALEPLTGIGIDSCRNVVGRWHGLYDGQKVDESWLPAVGGEMMGCFRWEREGKIWLYEFIQLVEAEGRVEMRLRHFNHDFTAWEEKDKPSLFDLVEAGGDRLIFRQRRDDAYVWLIYRWPSPDRMQVSFKREDKPHSVTSTFEFERSRD